MSVACRQKMPSEYLLCVTIYATKILEETDSKQIDTHMSMSAQTVISAVTEENRCYQIE